MKIIGCDPGETSSGLCVLDVDLAKPIVLLDDLNEVVITVARLACEDKEYVIGYEWVQNYGRVVGESVMRTCHMCGRLYSEAAKNNTTLHEPTRPQIVRHFTG